ncbi:hypothetical protein [Streptomyces sp. HC307]
MQVALKDSASALHVLAVRLMEAGHTAEEVVDWAQRPVVARGHCGRP